MRSHRRDIGWVVLLFAAACNSSTGAGDHPGVAGSPQSKGEALCAGGATLQGVDVSDDQGSINWAQAHGAGIAWGYAKATESTDYVASTFAANWAGMPAAGVARGAYHFFHPDVDGTAQADFFLSVVGALGPGDLPPMLDWEVTDGASGSTAGANAQAFVNEIQAKTGKQTVIYTTPGLWAGFGVPQSFGSDPLWDADWTYSPSSCPSLPSGWGNFVFWQWSDGAYGTGSVAGIPQTVDRDLFNGDAAALAQFASGSSAAACLYPLGHPVGGGGPIGPGCTEGAAPTLPAAPSGCGTIPVGEALGPGQSVYSCDGRFQLVLQTAGNVVEYEHGKALWDTNAAGFTGDMFVMQGDGNLVLYDHGSCPIWDSGTFGNPGSTFALQNDGNLVVYSPSGTPLWSSGSGPIPEVPSGPGTFTAGTGLGPGDSLSSPKACFELVMQTAGNLVLYQQGGKVLFDTNAAGFTGEAFVMQGDGNAVLYSAAGCPLWDTGTSGNSGAIFAVQDDGNLVVYSASGTPLWASNTVACPGGCSCLPPASGSSSSGGSSSGSSGSGSLSSTGGGSSSGSGTSSSSSGGVSSSGSGTSSSSSGSSTSSSSSGSGSSSSSSSGSSSGSTPAPTTPPTPTACGSIPVGDALGPGQSVYSCDGRFQLILQTAGNVVEYTNGKALWDTNAAGFTGDELIMQGDGNLVLYPKSGPAIWSSGTSGNPGATFAIQDDGNLVVYSASGQALWSSGTGGIPPVPTACGIFTAGTGLGPGDYLDSCQACFELTLQTAGNLVLYQQGGHPLWDTNASGFTGYYLVMQSDGNAVLYSQAGTALWSSGTQGNPGAYLAVQDDGNLVVYSSGGTALWASNSVACAGGCSCQ